MITRRHIRIKVLHHLYAHASGNELGAATLLKNLDKSLEEVHDLFIWDIMHFLEFIKLRRSWKVQSRHYRCGLRRRIAAFEHTFFETVASDDRL